MSGYQDKARHCAGLFRLGRDVEAGVEMVVLFEGALALFAAPALQQDATALLGQILAAQQRQDWIAVADSLEYDLVNLIGQADSA